MSSVIMQVVDNHNYLRLAATTYWAVRAGKVVVSDISRLDSTLKPHWTRLATSGLNLNDFKVAATKLLKGVKA